MKTSLLPLLLSAVALLVSCEKGGGVSPAAFQPVTYVDLKSGKELRLTSATDCELHTRSRRIRSSTSHPDGRRAGKPLTATWSETPEGIRVDLKVMGSQMILRFHRKGDGLVDDQKQREWVTLAAEAAQVKAGTEKVNALANHLVTIHREMGGWGDVPFDGGLGTIHMEKLFSWAAKRVPFPATVQPPAGRLVPVDHWGTIYDIKLDADLDGEVENPFGSYGDPEAPFRLKGVCLVVSAGPDGEWDTLDDNIIAHPALPK